MLKIISFRDRFVKTAKSDIKCFKVLQRLNDPNVAYSPYQGHAYILKQEETAILNSSFFSGKVEHGIHAFVNMSDAMELAKKLKTEHLCRNTFKIVCPNYTYSDAMWNWLIKNQYDKVNEVWKSITINFDIFECCVPMGALYYSGVWGSVYPQKLVPNIAANRLTVIRGINDMNEVRVSEERKSGNIEHQSVTTITTSQNTMNNNVSKNVNKIG